MKSELVRTQASLSYFYTALILGIFVYLGVEAWRSKLFETRSVQLLQIGSESWSKPPVDLEGLKERISDQVKGRSLLSLDLDRLRNEILKDPWIGEAALERHLPESLVITTQIRKPVAIYQLESGNLGYLDSEGVLFGNPATRFHTSLPVISGDRPQESVKVLRVWANSSAGKNVEISSLNWSKDRGYVALLIYPLSGNQTGRTLVELGQNIDAVETVPFERIKSVFSYLSRQSIQIRQILVGIEKKIVVKTNRGS